MVSADNTILATVFSIGVLWQSPSFVLVSLRCTTATPDSTRSTESVEYAVD